MLPRFHTFFRPLSARQPRCPRLVIGLMLLVGVMTARDASAQSDVLDDFTGPTLNTALWTYTNPFSDSPLTMTGTQVSIAVPGNRNHFIWSGINSAPRIMQATANADFEIEVKFD